MIQLAEISRVDCLKNAIGIMCVTVGADVEQFVHRVDRGHLESDAWVYTREPGVSELLR